MEVTSLLCKFRSPLNFPEDPRGPQLETGVWVVQLRLTERRSLGSNSTYSDLNYMYGRLNTSQGERCFHMLFHITPIPLQEAGIFVTCL